MFNLFIDILTVVFAISLVSWLLRSGLKTKLAKILKLIMCMRGIQV